MGEIGFPAGPWSVPSEPTLVFSLEDRCLCQMAAG